MSDFFCLCFPMIREFQTQSDIAPVKITTLPIDCNKNMKVIIEKR